MTVNKSIDCSAKPTTKVMHLYRRQGNYEMWLSRSLRKSSIISLIEEIQDKREACNQDIHRLLSEVLCQNMAFYQLPSSSTWILYVLNMKASSILSENDAVLRNCMTTCDDLFGLFKEHCPDSCGTCADVRTLRFYGKNLLRKERGETSRMSLSGFDQTIGILCENY